MSSSDSAVGELASSVHRSILGGLLAVVMIIAIGWGGRAVLLGNDPLGIVGLLVGIGAAYWIFDLLREGVREG